MDNYLKKIISLVSNPEIYELLIDKILNIVLILFLAAIIIRILMKLSEYILKTSEKANEKLGIGKKQKRGETVYKLIRSLIKYVVYFIAFIQIMTVFGVNTTGILASAGLVSVAIGFGAQSLVKDIITGFFLILEGQFDVGDYVKISNQAAFIAEGNVLSLGLRSTKILAKGGEVYFIPNSSINQVINFSQTYNLAKVIFPFQITDTLEQLESDIDILLAQLNKDERYYKYFYKQEKLKAQNIVSVENSIVQIEILVKATLGNSTKIESLLRKDFYKKFADRIRVID